MIMSSPTDNCFSSNTLLFNYRVFKLMLYKVITLINLAFFLATNITMQSKI